MTGTRSEHLSAARKLIRSMPSAPDPRSRASEIVRELARVEGSSPDERVALSEMKAWLGERPAVGQLKPRCEALLARFR